MYCKITLVWLDSSLSIFPVLFLHYISGTTGQIDDILVKVITNNIIGLYNKHRVVRGGHEGLSIITMEISHIPTHGCMTLCRSTVIDNSSQVLTTGLH